MEETKPSGPLLYPNINTLSEHDINDKILANNNKFNNINIIKDIKNYYEAETEIYDKKLSKYKTYIIIAVITKTAL